MLELSPGSVSIPPRMSLFSATTAWLQRNRTSARMALVWRMIAMALGSLFSLVWIPLLLRAMGNPLMGLFQLFQSVTRLGGLGDFGITAALGLKVGTMLGRNDETGLKALLASARTLFLYLAGSLCLLFIGLSPWLAKWLGFENVPDAGSMTWLFVYGGLSLAMMIVSGYFASLNYAHGTVTWPIFPTVLFAQVIAPFFHWRLALRHMPLWIQLLPYLGCAVLMSFLGWRMLKWSHPWMGNLTPLKQDRAEWKSLTQTSWWAYLVSLGTMIYVTTDRLVIGAAMGTDVIPAYQANYKVCDLGITVIVTAAFVVFPKITQWIASPRPEEHPRLLTELHRLSVFEIVMACVVTLGYLAFNNLFIEIWIGRDYQEPLLLQAAFAANLAVTCGGNAAVQTAMRAGDRGLKVAGIAALGTGLLNLGLSIVSVKLAPTMGVSTAITGVAIATVIAQSIYTIYLARVACRYLKISIARWVGRSWFLPMAFTTTATLLKALLPRDTWMHLGLLSVSYTILFLGVCALAGMNRKLLLAEIKQVRSMLLGVK
jgi:O-antigen/teichoic acid export membrane protein